MTQKYLDELTYKVVGCAIEVHKILSAGLLESVYQKCFVHELNLQGIRWKAQRHVDINYKGIELEAELRYDVLVEDCLLVEIKAVDCLAPVHEAQLLTYMHLLQKAKGILINFNCTNIFKEGQKTLVNKLYGLLPKE